MPGIGTAHDQHLFFVLHIKHMIQCADILEIFFFQGNGFHCDGPETRMMKRVEIEDARMASDVTEILMGSDVPPRKAFIYEHATDAELDI